MELNKKNPAQERTEWWKIRSERTLAEDIVREARRRLLVVFYELYVLLNSTKSRTQADCQLCRFIYIFN